jgi:Galactose oxidase, central domain
MRIRTFVAAGAILLASLTLLADTPGGRAETRMVYDPVTSHMILYGGATAIDAGTKVSYDLGDTWEWVGDHWIRRFTAHSPGERSGHALLYDSNRSRIVLFGGRHNNPSTNVQALLNDTWIFQNGDWSQLATPSTPTARTVPAAAFDPLRDRVVLFGGNVFDTDGKTIITIHDTWEFDGTTWTQRTSDGPKIGKPILVYDDATHQLILLGLDETSTTKQTTLMYIYDAASGTWNQSKPDGLPPCVNEAHVAFDGETNSVILVGGVCSDSNTTEDTFSWDGDKWTKLTVKTLIDRAFGGGIAYDAARKTLLQYGGTIAFAGSRVGTFGFHDGDWAVIPDTFSPVPRALPVAFTFPQNNALYVYGGHDESQTYEELWVRSNGQWSQVTGDNKPALCDNPLGTFDSDRQRFIIVCNAGNVFEFDGTTWTNKKDLKDKPPAHRLGQLSYNPTLKKTVLFGGYDETDFLDQTWLWDGTVWTRIKKDAAPPRGQAVMWYDATMKKTLLYGGIGRKDKDSRIERFADMWSFDGTGWTNMKVDAANTPGMRYSTSYAIDPNTGHLFVFGGLLYTKDSSTGVETQKYVNDIWEWDGAKWTKLSPAVSPEARENSGFTYDPLLGRMVLFGGFAAHYYGDLWLFDTTTKSWQSLMESPGSGRRRTAPTPQLPGSGVSVMRQ